MSATKKQSWGRSFSLRFLFWLTTIVAAFVAGRQMVSRQLQMERNERQKSAALLTEATVARSVAENSERRLYQSLSGAQRRAAQSFAEAGRLTEVASSDSEFVQGFRRVPPVGVLVDPTSKPVRVVGMIPNSPKGTCVAVGDLITHCQDLQVLTFADLQEALRDARHASSITLRIMRGEEITTLEIDQK